MRNYSVVGLQPSGGFDVYQDTSTLQSVAARTQSAAFAGGVHHGLTAAGTLGFWVSRNPHGGREVADLPRLHGVVRTLGRVVLRPRGGAVSHLLAFPVVFAIGLIVLGIILYLEPPDGE